MNICVVSCAIVDFHLVKNLVRCDPIFFASLDCFPPTVLNISPPPQWSEPGPSLQTQGNVGEAAKQVREAVRGPAGPLRPLKKYGQVQECPQQSEPPATNHPPVPRHQEGPHLLT